MKTITSIVLTLILTVSTGFGYPVTQSKNLNSNNSAELGLMVALFTICDSDHDRMLDQQDWSQAQQNYPDISTGIEFSNCDINGDDQVDINEFRHAVSKIDHEKLRGWFNEDPALFSKSNVIEIWNLDSDGKIERIAYGGSVIELDEDHN